MRPLTLLLLALAGAPLAACGTAAAPAPAMPAPASGAEAILRSCDAVPPAERAGCYETALLSSLQARGVRPTMQTLERMGELREDVRRDGHAYAHAIGLAAFDSPATVGPRFAECTPSFQSGCYHGVIQSYFADHVRRYGPQTVDAATVDALCADHRTDPDGRWSLFQCVHGIGHGLTMVFDHHLPRSLQGCDLLADGWEREGCYGGVFMESIVQATAPHHAVGRPGADHPAPAAATDPAHHDEHAGHDMQPAAAAPFPPLDPARPLYPCTVLDERYLGSCYQMQTSAILFFNGGDMPAALAACDGAPERYRHACYQSLGRDISAYTGQDHAEAVRLCSAGDSRFASWCHVGYVKNLVDLTAEPADGFRYCRSVPDGASKGRCYEAVGEEIWVLAEDSAQREAMCAAADPQFRSACRAGASLAGDPE